MSDTAVTVFLDRERTADLRPRLEELERTLGAATGAIVKRVLNAEFGAADCPTIVRLALIGVGVTPKEAAALAADYCTARPLAEQHQLATTIMLATWSGVPKPTPAVPSPAPAEPDGLYVRQPDGTDKLAVPLWSEAEPTPEAAQ